MGRKEEERKEGSADSTGFAYTVNPKSKICCAYLVVVECILVFCEGEEMVVLTRLVTADTVL